MARAPDHTKPPDGLIASYHEAGHAVVGWHLGWQIAGVYISGTDRSGRTTFEGEIDSECRVLVILAGEEAQQRFYPDANSINAFADAMEFENALTALAGHEPGRQLELRRQLNRRIRTIIANPQIWRAIEALSVSLSQRISLDGAEAVSIIEWAYDGGA
jgi:hypothetical protein